MMGAIRIRRQAEGADNEKITLEENEFRENERKRIRDIANAHIRASLGSMPNSKKVLTQLGVLSDTDAQPSEDIDSEVEGNS